MVLSKRSSNRSSGAPRLTRRRRRKVSYAVGCRAEQVESNLPKREKRRNVGSDGGGSGGDGLKSGKRKRGEGKSAGGEGGEMVVEAGAGSVRSKKGKRKMEAVAIVHLLGSIRKLTSEKEKKEWKKKKKKNRLVRIRRKKVGDEENRNGEAGLTEVDHVDARYVQMYDVTVILSGGNGATNKVYVGGIPYYSTEDDIRSFFESCGTISVVDCMSFPESGKFRGIAIITLKTEASAKRSLALDGADMGGLFF